jgi:hypothetical protein
MSGDAWGRLDAEGCQLIILTRDALAMRGIKTEMPVMLALTLRDGSPTTISVPSLDRVRELLPILRPSVVGFVGEPHEEAELRELAECWNSMQRAVAFAVGLCANEDA